MAAAVNAAPRELTSFLTVFEQRGAGDLDRVWDELAPHIGGLYLSFDTDPRPERLHDAFPGETLERLRRLKAVYDPDNVFNQNVAIAPAVLA